MEACSCGPMSQLSAYTRSEVLCASVSLITHSLPSGTLCQQMDICKLIFKVSGWHLCRL